MAAQFILDTAKSGDSIEAAGNLPAGDYQLCVVPNDVYQLGSVYSGDTLSCVSLNLPSDGTFGPITVWPTAQTGLYDLLALSIARTPQTILAADDPSSTPGLTVLQSVDTLPNRWLFSIFALLALSFAIPRSKRWKARVRN